MQTTVDRVFSLPIGRHLYEHKRFKMFRGCVSGAEYQ